MPINGRRKGRLPLETGDRTQRRERKLDLAARAAWLYYVAGNTQDEVAEKLSLSRQAAQRLGAARAGGPVGVVAPPSAKKLSSSGLTPPLPGRLRLGGRLGSASGSPAAPSSR